MFFNKNKILISFSFLILTLVPGTSNAGGEVSHGGLVVSCEGKPAVTLDYYNADLPSIGGGASLVDLSRLTEDQVVQWVRERLIHSTLGPLSVTQFDEALAAIGPTNSWIAADLKSIDDAKEPYLLPTGCVKMTGAIRQDSTVYGDPVTLALLDPTQKGLLRAHEALYYASNQDNSLSVREFFRVALMKRPNPAQLQKKILNMGFFRLWDTLQGGLYSYTALNGTVCQIDFRSAIPQIQGDVKYSNAQIKGNPNNSCSGDATEKFVADIECGAMGEINCLGNSPMDARELITISPLDEQTIEVSFSRDAPGGHKYIYSRKMIIK